ncbi:hypothetical protein R1flu_008097 [Riccia fluitans]|uniref:Protein kinase domain-containing protein n=1 Tax=Riccia fluitans TaxID=41844 RepID=A0ABD1YE91_9MARC
MGSIDVGRPPDGDSCSDEDESSVLFRAERELGADSPEEPAHWNPRAISFCRFSPPALRSRTGGLQGGGMTGLRVVVTRPLVVKLTKEIVETYQLCNPTFTYAVTFNPKRYLTNPSVGVGNNGQDNVNSDLILYVNGILLNAAENRRYIIKDMLGQGTFGQVCKCWTDDSNSYVAVKVIKNQPAYFHQAQVEIGICHMLNYQYDPGDNHNIVRILDHFVFEHHLCLVFELLQANLFELLKLNQFRGLSMTLVKSFTKQMLEALMVLGDACVIHCDLKPENILLQSLEAAEIKLIDFGSACTENRTVYSYIQSRFYRSPEVLLGHQYTTAIDIWSLGCVAAELFLGLPLFPGASEYDLLQRMIETLGSQPPDRVLRMAKNSSKFFKHMSAAPIPGNRSANGPKSAYQFLTEAEFEAREQKKPALGKRYFSHKMMDDIILNYPLRRKMTAEESQIEMENRKVFIDFLKGLVNLDPVSRWTPRQALQHPFLTDRPFSGPFRPPPETPRKLVGHGMAVEHNPGAGHWFGTGLSPQVSSGLRLNSQYHSSHFYPGGSYGSIGSYGSYGDGAGLGSSYGSYGESAGMYMASFPTTPVGGVNSQHQAGGSAGAALGVSPDTRRRMQVPTLPHNQLGISPSSGGFRAMTLGASPSHSQFAASPGSQFHGSPSSSHYPSPSSTYQASPSSQYPGSPGSHFLPSPSSPSCSPRYNGPTSPARAGSGISNLSKVAQYKMSKRRPWDPRVSVSNANAQHMAAHQQRIHQQNASGNEAGVWAVSSQATHPLHRRHRNGSAPHRSQSSSSYAPGSLGYMLNSADKVSEAGEDISPPPDPGDWDPNYSDDSLLDESFDASASSVTPLDPNGVVSGVSRLAPGSFSGPGQGVGAALLLYQHVHGSGTTGQSRFSSTVQAQVPVGSSLENNVSFLQNSSHGLQPSFQRNPSKHCPYAPQQTSPSRLGPQTSQMPQQHRQQIQSHQTASQQSQDVLAVSVGTSRVQMVGGEVGNNAAVGFLPSPHRVTSGAYAGSPRMSGTNGLGVVIGLPGAGETPGPRSGFHMVTGSTWLPTIVQEQHISHAGDSSSPVPPWGAPGYGVPYAQSLLPHEFSSLGGRSGPSLVVVSRPLPPTAPSRGNYGSRSTFLIGSVFVEDHNLRISWTALLHNSGDDQLSVFNCEPPEEGCGERNDPTGLSYNFSREVNPCRNTDFLSFLRCASVLCSYFPLTTFFAL